MRQRAFLALCADNELGTVPETLVAVYAVLVSYQGNVQVIFEPIFSEKKVQVRLRKYSNADFRFCSSVQSRSIMLGNAHTYCLLSASKSINKAGIATLAGFKTTQVSTGDKKHSLI